MTSGSRLWESPLPPSLGLVGLPTMPLTLHGLPILSPTLNNKDFYLASKVFISATENPAE